MIELWAPGAAAAFQFLVYNDGIPFRLAGDHSLARAVITHSPQTGVHGVYPINGNDIVDWLHELDIEYNPLTCSVEFSIVPGCVLIPHAIPYDPN